MDGWPAQEVEGGPSYPVLVGTGGPRYGAAGNTTHDATTGNNYSYDPENRITGAAGYTYDADGRVADYVTTGLIIPRVARSTRFW